MSGILRLGALPVIVGGLSVLLAGTPSAAISAGAAAPAGWECAALADDTEVRDVFDLPRPAYLDPYEDPAFGTTVTRITGDPGEPIANEGGHWGKVARHGYSKRSAWNADSSLLMLEQNSGGPSTVFLDGETYEPVDAADNPPGAEVRWDPLDADRLVFVEGNRLGTWSPLSGETEVEETFEGFSQLRIGPSEGNLSLDGQRIALIGKKGKRRFAFAYDRAAGELLTKLDLTDSGVDWISISPLGDRLVLNDQRDRTEVFDLDGERIQRWPEYGRPSHYDLALDSNGDQIAVGVAKSGAADGKVIMRRLDDGHVTVLSAGGYASHTSTRNVDRPGWAYVTHDLNRPGDYPPYRDEIFTVKLDGSGKVERLVQMHSRVPDYLSEPQAVPSPDGRRVLFASNWDKRSGRPIGTYVADLRDLCPPD